MAASAKVLACLVGTLIGEERDPATLDAYGRVELDRFLRYMRRRYDGEARERGLRFEVTQEPGLPPALRHSPLRPPWQI